MAASLNVPTVGSKWVLRGTEFVITVGKRPKLGRPTAEEAGLVWIYDDTDPSLDSVTLEEFYLRYDPWTPATVTPPSVPVLKAATARLILHLDPITYATLVLQANMVPTTPEALAVDIVRKATEGLSTILAKANLTGVEPRV